jgi:hypothetical protein
MIFLDAPKHWHHLAATAAILELFGVAKHFCTKNADSKLSYKYKDIQSEYVGNLDELKLFRKRMEAFDMFDPFLIPTWFDPDAISLLDLLHPFSRIWVIYNQNPIMHNRWEWVMGK